MERIAVGGIGTTTTKPIDKKWVDDGAERVTFKPRDKTPVIAPDTHVPSSGTGQPATISPYYAGPITPAVPAQQHPVVPLPVIPQPAAQTPPQQQPQVPLPVIQSSNQWAAGLLEGLFGLLGGGNSANQPVYIPEAPAATTPAAAPATAAAMPVNIPAVTVPETAPPAEMTPTNTFYKNWKSVADPHVTKIDGTTFDQGPGQVNLAHSNLGRGLDVTTDAGPVDGRSGVWNTAATVSVGSDQVSFDAETGLAVVNGQPMEFRAGTTQSLPGGGKIEMVREDVNGKMCDKLYVFTGLNNNPSRSGEYVALLRYEDRPYIDVAGHLDKGRTDLSGLIVGGSGVTAGGGPAAAPAYDPVAAMMGPNNAATPFYVDPTTYVDPNAPAYDPVAAMMGPSNAATPFYTDPTTYVDPGAYVDPNANAFYTDPTTYNDPLAGWV